MCGGRAVLCLLCMLHVWSVMSWCSHGICGSLLHFTAQFSTISIVYHISNAFPSFARSHSLTLGRSRSRIHWMVFYNMFPPRRRLVPFLCIHSVYLFSFYILRIFLATTLPNSFASYFLCPINLASFLSTYFLFFSLFVLFSCSPSKIHIVPDVAAVSITFPSIFFLLFGLFSFIIYIYE